MTKQRAYQVRQWFNGRCPRCGGIRDQVYAECSTCREKRRGIYGRYNRKRRGSRGADGPLAFQSRTTVYVEAQKS